MPAAPDYFFSVDWVTPRVPYWPKFPDPKPPLRAMEIGSHEGRSAIWMLENLLTHPESRLTCIDIWRNPEVEKRFDRNIYISGQSTKVQKIKDDHWRALCHQPYGFDLVYIDGSHEAQHVLEDAVWCFRLTKPGGFLIFDDYLWNFPQATIPPKPAIDGFLASYAPRIELVHKDWQVIIQKK